MQQLNRVKANSVIHYHAVIHRALKYAVKIDLIDVKPADKVERPKVEKFVGSFYDSGEVEKLFEAAKGTLLEIPIFLGAFYGLRRSEVLGLRWSAIDFRAIPLPSSTRSLLATLTVNTFRLHRIPRNQIEYAYTSACARFKENCSP